MMNSSLSKKKISALQAEIDAEENHRHSAATFLRTVKRYTDIQELTPLILNELVEKIVGHQVQGIGKNRTQQLEIHYNFIGVLDTPAVTALPHRKPSARRLRRASHSLRGGIKRYDWSREYVVLGNKPCLA